MKNTKIKMNKNQKGQTLLFVIVAVTIAMAVGVSVSTRTIQSLKRVARTDTSARVIAAAEGGIENLLGRSYKYLDDFIAQGNTVLKCGHIGATPVGAECSYVFTAGTGDLISSRAVVQVEKFNSNEANNGYSFTLDPGSLKEVNLDGPDNLSNIKICWDNNQSAIYYYSYNSDGDVLKGGIKPNGTLPTFMNLSDRFDDSTYSESGYDYCKTVSLVSNSYGLRIKVLYNSSKVAVFPTDVALPPQGYKLTSRGEIVTGSGSEEKATVIVHKSLPYASDIFDYGIYTPTTLSGSN